MTLQIEAGKYYRTRDGRKVGPMLEWSGDAKRPFDVDNAAPGTDLSKSLWTREGASDEGTQADLIAEWRDDTPAHIITHEGREYDLTALETPFGILQEKAPPVAEALKAWPHGLLTYSEDSNGLCQKWAEIKLGRMEPYLIYRAKPAPVEDRVKCYRREFGETKKFGTCIKRADGSIDWDTWEPEV